MNRLPVLLLALLVGCAGSIDGTSTTKQKTACYDTGSGVSCVPEDEVPPGTPTMCTGGDPIDDDDDDLDSDTDDDDDDDADECGMPDDDDDDDGVANADDCDCPAPAPPPGV